MYEEQAETQIVAGNVSFGDADQYGVRCTIVIVVRGEALRSGWILRSDGVLWLVTPFSGFDRDDPKG
jgi:hypothetical protein